MRLENTNPQTASAFRAFFEAAGVALPLKRDDDNIEIVLDARGRVVFQADPDGTMSDAAVRRLRDGLLIAVNTCAGLKAARP